MHHLLERTWANIDLDAVQHNFQTIRQAVSPDCRILAVIKANAYGHGIEGVAKALSEAGAGWFAVSNLEEAIQLRQHGLKQRILILSHTPPAEVEQLVQYNVTTAVVDLSHAIALNHRAASLGNPLTVHIKLDTGMTRVGCCDIEQAAAICKLPYLRPEGIFTHFSTADIEDDGGFARQQFTRFTGMVKELEQQGFHFDIRHCCNSAATMRYSDMHLDMVRPGIILYGCPPDGWMQEMWPLKPVMSLQTAIIQVKTIPAGTPIGYGRTYLAPHEIKLATVPIGYADGYPRSSSNRAYMLLKGVRVPVVGRVCMDQCMLDVTGVPDVKQGDVVTVFGDGLPVADLAASDDTIPYETFCKIGKRVPRVFIKGGQVTDIANLYSTHFDDK